jgi:hypothetical protein
VCYHGPAHVGKLVTHTGKITNYNKVCVTMGMLRLASLGAVGNPMEVGEGQMQRSGPCGEDK